jgi:hypothetical protein
MYTLRETLNRIAGVTSLVNLQSLVVALVCAYRPLTGRRLPQPYRRLIVVLAILCVLRAWLWSERLALIELALPLTVATFAKPTSGQGARLIRPLAFAPLLGLVAVFAIFTRWGILQVVAILSIFLSRILSRLHGGPVRRLLRDCAQHRRRHLLAH